MPRAAPPPDRRSSRPRPIALEDKEPLSWVTRCRRTLVALVVHPVRSFRVCPEPIAHGRVMRYLATLRVTPWVVLLVVLGVRQLVAVEDTGVPMRAVYTLVEPSFVRVLSLWILLMIPVGLPLLYFFEGLVAHVGVALTGGASRSIGASMRACGYVLGLVLLVVGLVDIPLYLGHMPGSIYLWVVVLLAALHWIYLGIALAKTHQMTIVRGILVALLPTVVFAGVTVVRALPELTVVPTLPEPGSGYAVP